MRVLLRIVCLAAVAMIGTVAASIVGLGRMYGSGCPREAVPALIHRWIESLRTGKEWPDLRAYGRGLERTDSGGSQARPPDESYSIVHVDDLIGDDACEVALRFYGGAEWYVVLERDRGGIWEASGRLTRNPTARPLETTSERALPAARVPAGDSHEP